MKERATILAIILIASMIISNVHGEIIYVDVDAIGDNNGSSWMNAFNYLQDALAAVQSGDEIRVAEGVYKPDQGIGILPGDRTATFQLKNGIVIKGGYAGFDEPDPSVRDIHVYETCLSGDLFGDDGPALITDLADCLTGSQVRPKSGCEAFDLDGDNDVDEKDLLTFLTSNNYDENSYNVVTSIETDETAVLDGFIITGGNSNSWEQGYEDGAGMFNKSASPTLTNCAFIGNRAQFMGGGMYNNSESSPTLTNCTFSGNIAIYGGGMSNEKNSNPTLTNCTFSHNNSPDSSGGGMSNKNSSPTLISCIFSDNTACDGGAIHSHTSDDTTTPCDLILTNCTLRGNSAEVAGGGMYSYHASATLTNCVFSGNSVERWGGGMHNHGTSPTLRNCLFAGNWAGQFGGGIHNWYHSSAILANCTFSGNSADSGGAICNKRKSTPILTNCILWGNAAIEGDNISLVLYHWAGNTYRAGISVNYSDVEGGELGVHVETGCTLNWGQGNFDADPLFVEPGYWDANDVWIQGDYHLLEDSLCIDAGDPNFLPFPGETDIDGEPRVMGGRMDMGSDEFTSTHTPILMVSPTEFRFSSYENGPNPKEQIMSIRNIGSGTLNWGIAEDCPWLDVYPSSGESTGQFNEVTLSADITGMDPDSYECLLTIDAIEALNSPQVVKVTLKLGGSELFVPSEYDTIQAAIDAAIDWDTVIVADGTYTGFGNRDIDFLGKAIIVRSKNGPEHCIIDCNGTEVEPHRGFYFHCDEDHNSVLSGLTITNGYAGYGGGICCVSSHPTITNCIIRDNTGQYWYGGQYGTLTQQENSRSIVNDDGEVHINIPPPLPGWRGKGGGISCRSMSSPMLTNCKFIGNSAYEFGGGIYKDYNSNPILTYCTFTSNTALYGGAMYNYTGSPSLTNCTFIENSAGMIGGGMQNIYSSPRLLNCIFNGNSARWEGGCMSNYRSNPILTNCTFSRNTAVNGGVIFNSGSDAMLSNCILRGNTASEGNEIYLDFYTDFLGSKVPSTINVDYSNVEGGAAGVYVDTDCTLNWGEGNINADPCFFSPGYRDTNGVWIEGDYHLLPGSPCIDSGDPNYAAEPNETDLDGRPRVIGGRIDMGAYEHMPSIPAEVRIIPRTLNLASKGNWLTCYIWLPEEYNVADIDPYSVFLEGEIQPVLFSIDEQKQVVTARFIREKLRGIISTGEVELTISGQLKDGTIFEGTDVIKVID